MPAVISINYPHEDYSRMKATADTLSAAAVTERSWISIYADLVKARLTFLVLLTASMGFYLGSLGGVDFALMLHLLMGTGLIAGGAAALNQLLERDLDARMARTQSRPLPAGQVQPETVLAFGAISSALGLGYLTVLVNPMTGLLGGLTWFIYLFIYTPLKRVTWLNTVVGAVPGALPPLMGWVAARNAITWEAASLFAIQFCWQIPHFLAIAWLYRNDYQKAGFKMLSVHDETGKLTGRWAVVFASLLIPVSLVPVFFGTAGLPYLVSALILGLAFAGTAAQFARQLTLPLSRRLFWMSILYLPLLFGVLVLDKAKL